MRRRRFRKSERVAIFLESEGKCANCGEPLGADWHADHIEPWSKGGLTDVINGRALCATCNLRKGNRMQRDWPKNRVLRGWQVFAFNRFVALGLRNFMMVACPGSGKTLTALRMAFEELSKDRSKRFVVVCPTDHLKFQWALAAASVGIRLDPNWSNDRPLARDYDGVVITYAQVDSNPQAVRMLCRVPVVAILDEIHHAGDTGSWGKSLETALEHADRRILLSGTPFRRKGVMPFVQFDDDGVLIVHVDYAYGAALSDGICRPIYFPSYEGKMAWYNRGVKYEKTFGDKIGDDDSAKRLRTALLPNGEWLAEVIRDGEKLLSNIRPIHPDAAGLIVAMDNAHADAIARRVREITGEMPVVVHSDRPNASDLIGGFAKGHSRWIVAVRMISEGVDIPRLRVGIFATNITTELFFRQFAGRFLRMIDGLDEQNAYLLIPRDEVFVSIIAEFQKTRLQVLDEQVARDMADLGAHDDRLLSTFLPISATAEAHDVFHPDGVSVGQAEIQAARRYMAEAGAPTSYDASIVARILRAAAIRPVAVASGMAAVRDAPCEDPVFIQKRKLRDVIKKFVGRIIGASDGALDYETVYGELKKFDRTGQGDCTREQLQARVEYLRTWLGRLTDG